MSLLKRRIYTKVLLALFIVCVLLGFGKTYATVMVWHNVPSVDYGVSIRHASNHGYVEQYKPIWYVHTLRGLAEVRKDLVTSGKIEDIQVVFEIPSPVFQISPEFTQITLEDDCMLPAGDSGLAPRSIGRCYRVHYVGSTNYEDFLTVMAYIPEVSEEKPLSITDLNAQEKSVEATIDNFNPVERFFYPVWSPNSKFVVFTRWEDGNVSYSIRQEDGSEIKQVQLDGLPVSVPVWSPDSKYMAIASLDSIGLYDSLENSWNEIQLPPTDASGKYRNSQLFISFDTNENKLLISRDLNYFAGYELLSADLSSGEVIFLAKELTEPKWEEYFDGQEYLLSTRSTSPNGMYDAFIDRQIVGGNTIETPEITKIYGSNYREDGSSDKKEQENLNILKGDGKSIFSIFAKLLLPALSVVGVLLIVLFMIFKISRPRSNSSDDFQKLNSDKKTDM